MNVGRKLGPNIRSPNHVQSFWIFDWMNVVAKTLVTNFFDQFVIGRVFYVSCRPEIFLPLVRGPRYRIKSILFYCRRTSTVACVTSTCKQLGFFQKSNELETSGSSRLGPSDWNEFRHGQTFFENIIVSCWHIYWFCLCCWLHFSIWTSCHNKRHFWIRVLNFQT